MHRSPSQEGVVVAVGVPPVTSIATVIETVSIDDRARQAARAAPRAGRATPADHFPV
jgi:hypothetical protein